MSDTFKDKLGCLWRAFVDHAGRRRVKCDETGQVEDDPRNEILVPTEDEIRARQEEMTGEDTFDRLYGRDSDSAAFWRGVYEPPFWEK